MVLPYTSEVFVKETNLMNERLFFSARYQGPDNLLASPQVSKKSPAGLGWPIWVLLLVRAYLGYLFSEKERYLHRHRVVVPPMIRQ